MSANAAPAAVPDETPSAAPVSKRELRLFVRNVVAIVVLGVAVSWWLLEYTDFFPAVGGFLGLGGIFAWVAFFSNLVRDDRKSQLQNELEQHVLLNRATATYVLMLLIVCAVWAALHGTIVVIAPGEGAKRAVEIRDGSSVIDTIEVDPASTVKTSLRTLRGRRNLTLKVSGLPDLEVTARSFSRTSVVIPQSFMTQPVLLARTSPDVAAVSSAVKVQIKRGNAAWVDYGTIAPGGYTGESIWVGASADTEVPASARERWRRQGREDLNDPKAVGADRPLRAGDRIRLCIMNAEGGEAAFGEATVLPDKQRAFPQEMQLVLTNDDQTRCGR